MAATADPITDRWTALGGSAGVLGDPVGARQAVGGGERQDYQRGVIWWSPTSGAWEARGAVSARFLAIGDVGSGLGFPTGTEQATAGGVGQRFQGGAIWWSARTGAWETANAVGSRFAVIGGPGSALGFPVGAEASVGGGVRQSFQTGDLWWSGRSGAWETAGAIGARFLAIGGVTSALGFPRSAEEAVPGGVRQSYTGADIWWSGVTGAWETAGAVGARFLAIGGVTSGLGFPRSAEQAVPGGVRQTYAGGNIWWSGATGAWDTHGAINDDYWRSNGSSGWYGFPTSGEYGYQGGVRQDFRQGSLLWNVQPVLDATYASVGASDVWATWRAGCPVGPESLTLIRLNYWGFDNAVHRGEIIIRADLAGRLASIFGAALADRFPIRQMWRVDYFGGDDPTAMAADNTPGFNCRQVTGGAGLSPHSYGIAVDVNTVENPYYAQHWWPTNEYVDRSNVRVGMLFSGSAMTVAFRNNGFQWGASYLDYQHYEYVG